MALRQPSPAPEGHGLWTPISLALAFSLRALAGKAERKVYGGRAAAC